MVGVENHIGKITISEGYITALVRHAVCDCFGVADMCNTSTLRSVVSAMTGGRVFRDDGVVVRSDKNGELTIDIHIKVTYGTNIEATVDSVIHKVTFVIGEAVDAVVKSVNVYVDEMSE